MLKVMRRYQAILMCVVVVHGVPLLINTAGTCISAKMLFVTSRREEKMYMTFRRISHLKPNQLW